MARNVGDLALLLSVMAGPDPRAPLALGDPGRRSRRRWPARWPGCGSRCRPTSAAPSRWTTRSRRWSTASAAVFAGAGASVVAAHPDLAGADDTFRTLRAWHFQAKLGPLLAEHPDAFKQSLADNIRAGEPLTGADVARAYTQRTALVRDDAEFFASYDVLVLPVSQVPPFPADQEYPTAINGRPMETYLDWMRSAYFITVTGCPAISVPAGTTPDGLPVGIQIVAPHGADRRLLEVAAAFERGRTSRSPRAWLPRIAGRPGTRPRVCVGAGPATRFWACCPIPSAARRRCARTTSASTGPRRRSDPWRGGAPRCSPRST